MLVKPCALNDIGTRAEHLMELQDIWNFALGLLTTSVWHSDREKHQAEELQIALDLLMSHVQSMYVPTFYAREINALPKPNNEPST
jgi:hypothetical protein